MNKKKGSIKDVLRDFIVSNYMKGYRTGPLADDDSFLDQGIIDSVGVIELTAFVQRTYGISVGVNDIMPENFDTLNNLEKYIMKKNKEKTVT